MTDFSGYLSPFSWRYASKQMRAIWSEENKRRLWRRIWLALAETQAEFGLVPPAHLAELRSHVDDLDIPRALQIEAEIHHDLMAELKTYAAQCPQGGGSLHLGATSMDIEDNADALRLRQSAGLILERLAQLLAAFSSRIKETADLPCMAFTHLQPAEPTTYGFRLSFYAQDLMDDFRALQAFLPTIRGKGFRGAVGTSAAYAELIGLDRLADFESRLSTHLELPFFQVTHQTYPRRQEYHLLSLLASIALTLNKFAFDLRILQSPSIGEVSEPFGSAQVGSSAMPFKRNPINSEKIDSLARNLSQAPLLAWHNGAHSLLERTLDDSANRRTLLPESFLALDELLITANKLVSGFKIQESNVTLNLERYGPFAATERLLMALSKAGADRQEMHEIIRNHSLSAWQDIQAGKPNPLINLLALEARFSSFISREEILQALTVEGYLGDAPIRARQLADRINQVLNSISLHSA